MLVNIRAKSPLDKHIFPSKRRAQPTIPRIWWAGIVKWQSITTPRFLKISENITVEFSICTRWSNWLRPAVESTVGCCRIDLPSYHISQPCNYTVLMLFALIKDSDTRAYLLIGTCRGLWYNERQIKPRAWPPFFFHPNTRENPIEKSLEERSFSPVMPLSLDDFLPTEFFFKIFLCRCAIFTIAKKSQR